MNWDKAKNLTIFLLLLVNVFLGGLVYSAELKFTMTSAQEDAVMRYLAQNGVSLYTTIPRDFRPVSPVRILQTAYNANELVPVFFGGTENISLQFDGGQSTYTRGEEMLVVEGDSFFYENTSQRPGFVMSKTNAEYVCNQFLTKNAEVFGKYVRDRVRETKDGYEVSYCTRFRNRLIVSNSMVFSVNASGISRVVSTYNRPTTLPGEPREILSPDEALYKFVKHMNYLYGDQEILLDSMSLVYYLAEITTDSSIPLNATPYYRFYVFSGDVQVMMNAYTGGILDAIY